MEFMTIDIFLTVVGCTSVITLLTQVFKKYLPETIDVKWLALVFSIIVGMIRMCIIKDFSFEGIVIGIMNMILLLAIAIGEYEVVKAASNRIIEKIGGKK